VKQINAALGFLTADAAKLGIDASRLFLAGDSAGAQLSAQLANLVTVPSYAQSVGIAPAIAPSALRGLILHCGPYDIENANFEGGFGGFMRAVVWAYLGAKDFKNDPRLAELTAIRHITGDFPPFFISVGNADPLWPQSVALAEKAKDLGVEVDALFFPAGYQPPLHHEYQFTLDHGAGKQALARAVAFVQNRGALP
jgi:acetyl esterase/lipase